MNGDNESISIQELKDEEKQRQELHEYMRRLSDGENPEPPRGMCVHVTRTAEPCDHKWDRLENPEYCVKCGMSFTRYIFMECP